MVVNSPICNCGQIQTIRHIVEECPKTKFSGETLGLHKGDEEALDWLHNLVIIFYSCYIVALFFIYLLVYFIVFRYYFLFLYTNTINNKKKLNCIFLLKFIELYFWG